jgi:hypothetical protein
MARARGKSSPSSCSKSSSEAKNMNPPGTRTAIPTTRRSNSTAKRCVDTTRLLTSARLRWSAQFATARLLRFGISTRSKAKCGFIRRRPQTRPAWRAGARGLESCGAALGVELRPSKLRMPSHDRDMARGDAGSRSVGKDSWLVVMGEMRSIKTIGLEMWLRHAFSVAPEAASSAAHGMPTI